MSRKAQQFANIITQPLNIYNFLINIPAISFSNVVQSSVFPSEQLQTMSLFTQGEEVRYPTKPKNGGQWPINIPEADSGIMRREFEALKSAVYDQRRGIILPTKWYDINVTSRDEADNPVFSAILHGCWILGRQNVNLNAQNVTDSWKWDYLFIYQWLEDKDHNNPGTPNPFR